MATIVFNVGKGRPVEMYRNVKAEVRSNAAFIIVLLQDNELDASIKDRLTLEDILTDISNTEATFDNYTRKQIVGTDLAAFPSPNNTGDSYDITFPDVLFTSAGGTTNNNVKKCLLCYTDDTVGVVDANIVPLVAFDYVTTTDGSNLLIEFPADAFSSS